jgi:hypothetical protein
MIPILTGGAEEGLSFNPGERRVVEKIDQRRSLEGIALALGQSPFEIAKIAFGLVSSGVIELRQYAPFLEPERLENLDPRNVTALTTRVYTEALGKMENNDSLGRLEALHDAALNREEHQETTVALIELILGAHHLLSSDLGPEQASSFYDRVEELIGEL